MAGIPSVGGVFAIHHTCPSTQALSGAKLGRLVVRTGGLSLARRLGLCVRGRRYWATLLTAQGLGSRPRPSPIIVLSEDNMIRCMGKLPFLLGKGKVSLAPVALNANLCPNWL